jgi:molecular chaperone GrpE
MMPKDDAENSKPTDAAEKPEKTGGLPKPDDIQDLAEGGDEVEYEPIKDIEAAAEKAEHEAPRSHEGDDKSLKHKLKKKEAEIKNLKKEKEEIKDKYLRKLAEMENLRKRFERERAEYEQYALNDFLRELLVVLDNFERALQSRPEPDGKSFQEGVEMIYRQYLDLLKKKGVVPIEINDKKFDPTLHQAVSTEESEAVDEPEVAEEMQRGYLLHGRLLRPALVKVIVPKKREEE